MLSLFILPWELEEPVLDEQMEIILWSEWSKSGNRNSALWSAELVAAGMEFGG